MAQATHISPASTKGSEKAGALLGMQCSRNNCGKETAPSAERGCACVSEELGCSWLSLGGKNGLFSQVSGITQAAPASARACAPAREALYVRKTLRSPLLTPQPHLLLEMERSFPHTREQGGQCKQGPLHTCTGPSTPRAPPSSGELPSLLLPRCLPFHQDPKARLAQQQLEH